MRQLLAVEVSTSYPLSGRSMVHRRVLSVCTVTSWQPAEKELLVDTRPPNPSCWSVRSHWRPVVVTVAAPERGSRPQCRGVGWGTARR